MSLLQDIVVVIVYCSIKSNSGSVVYDSCLIPSQVVYFQEKRAADRETPDATTSYHKPGGMDKDRNEDISMK